MIGDSGNGACNPAWTVTGSTSRGRAELLFDYEFPRLRQEVRLSRVGAGRLWELEAMEASRRETAPTPSGLILTTRYGSQSGELMPSCALIRQTFPSNRANSNVRQRNKKPASLHRPRCSNIQIGPGARPQAERVRSDERPQEGQRRQPFVRSILRKP